MKFFSRVLIILLASVWGISYSQCTIDTTNTHVGFSPGNPAAIKVGVYYSQTAQVYIPVTFSGLTIDSLHIDSIGGLPTGITYVLNPASGTVRGGSDGAICFSGTSNDIPGLYPLTFYGNIYSSTVIPISAVSGQFSYKLRLEAHPVAAFTALSPACAAIDSVKLSDLTTGYPTSWTWTFTGGSPVTSHAKSPSVLFNAPGAHVVKLVAKNAVGVDSITQSITVNPAVTGTVATLPASGDSVANGYAIAILSGGTPPFTYLWSNTGVTDTISNLVAGTYWLSATDTKGCSYVNDNVNVTFISGILQLSADMQVKVYPNPATELLNLEWSQKSEAEVCVIDMGGNVLSTFVTTSGTKNTLNIHDLAPGIYILRLTEKAKGQQRSMLFTKF